MDVEGCSRVKEEEVAVEVEGMGEEVVGMEEDVGGEVLLPPDFLSIDSKTCSCLVLSLTFR